MDPTTSQLNELRSLRKQGLYVQGWRLLQELTPPEGWKDPAARTEAALVLDRVGASDRARRLILRVWHGNPTSSCVAREEVLWLVFVLRGALAAHDWQKRYPLPAGASATEVSDDLAWEAYWLGRLRDFAPAVERVECAAAAAPDHSWPLVVRGWLAAWQDRHEEALDWLQRAQSMNPAGVGGWHALADTFIALGRDDEAVAVLEAASSRLEAASLASSLTNLLIELGRFEAAERSLVRYAELIPGGEPDERAWLAARRCDLACHRRDYAAAAVQARQVPKSKFYGQLADRLEAVVPGLARRELPVGFVRQHHLTCAPATFTTLARYWNRTIDHLDLATAICHDGTPYHSERRWAEENDWVTREFTISAAAARSLIDAGLPFTLSTVQPGNAHCQAVIGYDDFRGVLLIRDPYYRSKGEFLIEEGLADQAPFGPRGFVMVPRAEAHRLGGLELPEAELYDAYHALQVALEAHRREEAGRHQDRLAGLAPGHRLAWQGAHALACYDGQPSAALAALDALHALFPKEVNTQIRRLNRLADLERVEERRRQLEDACRAPGSDPLLWMELARALSIDARRHAEARRWLRRCLRHRLEAWAVQTEGTLMWDAQAFEEATGRFRIASCLDDKSEGLALTYFKSARSIGRTAEALELLRGRFERDGARSSAPARSLAQAYEMLDRFDEALAVLDEAQRRRPGDMDLCVHRARQLAVWGREAEAESLLASVSGAAVRPGARLRVMAALADRRGSSAESAEVWRQVLASEPLAMDAHRSLAILLDEREGAGAGLAHLHAASAAHPHYQPLQVAVVDWARAADPVQWEQAVRTLLATDPESAWGHRELALALRAQRRWPDALASADEAIALDPAQAAGPNIRGLILLDHGRREEGRQSLKAGLRLSIDADTAMGPLLDSSASPAERLADLHFLRDELIRQTTTGEAVLTFADLASPYLGSDELLSFLREGHAARPDLWQTGTVLARHLARLKHWQEAVDLATQLTRRFPLVPRLWVELGHIHRARPDHDAAIEALKHACQLNPAWPFAMQELAAAYRAASRFAEARATMETAVRHAPSDALNQGWLAEFLYHDGEKEAALHHVREALRLSPGYEWAWGALDRWGREVGQPDASRVQARALVSERPGEARSWYVLAGVLSERGEFDERVAALDRALELNPRFHAARDEKARHLALAGRFDQALDVCRPSEGEMQVPPELEARAAWVLSRKGEMDQAIATMRSALERDSALTWGWEQLAEWHQARKEWEAAEEAVGHLIRLNPHRPFPYGYLGDLKLQRNDVAAAKREFRRALDVDASYTYGGLSLFNLHLQEREFDEARVVLDRLRPHLPALTTNVRDVIRHLHAGDREATRLAVRQLLECREDAPPQVDYALRVLREKRPAFAPVIRDESMAVLARPDPPPHAGVMLAESVILAGQLPNRRQLALLPPGPVATERALEPTLNEIGRRLQAAKSNGVVFGWVWPRWYFARLRRRYGRWLHENDLLWGLCGYVFFTMGAYRHVCRWLSDWDQRPSVQPWMLNNLAVAHQVLGQREEFERVSRHVLSLPQHDDTVQRFHLWAALESALTGHADAAAAHVAATDASRYDGYDRSFKKMLDVVLRYQRNDTTAPAFDAAAKADLSGFLGSHRSNRLVRSDFKRACRLIADRTGSRGPVIWGFFQRHRWLLLALYAVVATAALIASLFVGR